MKFEAILEYQRVDQELIALETEATQSKELVALFGAKKNLESATSAMGKITGEASEILANQAKLQEKQNALKTKLAEFDGIIENVEDLAEAEYYLKQVDTLITEITALEKELSKESSRIDGVDKEFKSTWDAGTKASETYKQANLAYKKYMEGMQPKVKEIKDKLDALRKEIPDDLYNHYKALRDPKKMPVFVEYDSSKKMCGRCRMEMSNDIIEKLRQSGDYAECPNCRRINFIA